MKRGFLQSLGAPTIIPGPGGVVVGVGEDKAKPPPKPPPNVGQGPPPNIGQLPEEEEGEDKKKKKKKKREKEKAKAKCKRYSVRVQAQGKDIGGTTKSGKFASKTSCDPITVAEGLILLAAVMAQLTSGQRKRRLQYAMQATQWMWAGPPKEGYPPGAAPNFPRRPGPGGIRIDIEIHGDGNSFVN